MNLFFIGGLQFAFMKAVKATLLYDGFDVIPRKNVFIVYEGERITGITKSRPDCEVVAEGIVTPAFVDGHSHIGLARSGEPSSEDEANEQMGSMLPLVNALDSVYMDDSAFRDSVEHGVLYSHVMPGSGNIIGGKTALVRNFARDIEDAFIMQPGIKAALGYNPRSTTSWKGERPHTRMGALSILRNEFIKARKAQELLASKKKVQSEIEPHTEALIEILEGRQTLMTHVHKEDDIVNLIRLINEFGFRAVIHHAVDVHSLELWKKVKRANLDVIFGPLDAFAYKVELKHENWRNGRFLVEAGVRFGLMTDHPVILQRNLFLQLRFFLRFGMTRQRAISLVSSQPAAIIGSNDIGAIEGGRLASLVVWNADPFSLESWPSTVIGEGRVVVG